MQSKIKKILVGVSLLSIIIQSTGANFFASPKVFAEEEVSSSPSTIQDSPDSTQAPSVSPTPTMGLDQSPSPTDQPVDSIPSPAVDELPLSTPSATLGQSDQNLQTSDEGNSSGNKSPPEENQSSVTSENPTPTLTVVSEAVEKGEITAVLVQSEEISDIADLNLELGQVSPSSAQLTTDKSDYTPTDIVIISGKNFDKNQTFTLVISSNDEPSVNFQAEVKTDENGGFIYSYQLDGTYRPNYKVEVKDSSGEIIAQTTFTDAALKLYTDGSHVNEGYQFALGGTVFGQAIGLNTNRGYKFDVLDLDGSVIPGTTTSCITGDAIPGNNYVTTKPSDSRNFTFELHEWDSSTCSGNEKGGSPTTKTFNVAAATSYTDSTLTTPTASYNTGSTAYVVVNGLSRNKNDWHTTWVKPDSTTACANNNGSDRPNSSQSGALPDAAPAYLEYPPSASDNKWNDPDKYDDDCEAFSASNVGAWKLNLTKDNLNVTLSVFSVNQPNTPPSFDPIANQTVDENSSSQDVAITNVSPGPSGESGQTVTMSATSSDPTIVPNPSVSGAGSTRTLTYTPVANQFGTVTITVTANDGQPQNNTFSRTFTITVNEVDTTPPVSTFSSPSNDSVWKDPIYISGSSTDIPNTTVAGVNVYAQFSGNIDWGDPIMNFEGNGDDPFYWADYWTPGEDGTYDFKVSAVDDSGNIEESDYVYNVVYDATTPTSDIEYPADEVTYTEESWNEDGEIRGSANDDGSGVSTVYVSIQRDSDGAYWCDINECGESFGWYDESEGETLNEAEFDGLSWTYGEIDISDLLSGNGTEGYTIRSHAEDNAGNQESTAEVHFYVENDTTAPVSTIDSPTEDSYWNSPIEISGSSTDEPQTTVDYVNFYYRTSGQEEDQSEWTEIPDSQQNNEDEVDPFEWSFNWTPDTEGTFDIKAEATDKAGNVEQSPVVEYVTYDVTDPTSDITFPEEDGSYTEEEWDDENNEIRGTASDEPSIGINSVLVSIQRDSDNLYWDGDNDEEDGIGWRSNKSEFLNEATLGEGDAWSFSFAFIDPEGADEGYTVRSHAVDNAGNQENTSEVHFFFERAPVISDEAESSVSTSSVTIAWTTDFPATSRVIYDIVSHLDLGEEPNYGYANSTEEEDTDPKVTSHSVDISGLTAGTTYYYRTISHGSPEAVSDENNFTTSSPAPTPTPTPTSSSSGGSTGDGKSDGLGCGSKDCSGNVASAPQALGALISPLATGFSPEILGEATSEAQLSPVPTQGVLGEEEKTVEEKPLIQINKGFGWKKMTATALVLILVVLLFWFLRRRHKKEGL